MLGNQGRNGQSIWLILLGIALLVTIMFVIFFREKHVQQSVEGP